MKIKIVAYKGNGLFVLKVCKTGIFIVTPLFYFLKDKYRIGMGLSILNYRLGLYIYETDFKTDVCA